MAIRDRTVIVRVIGDLYDSTVQCSRLEATGACIRSGARIPDFALAIDHSTIECDLRGLPGQASGTKTYFDLARSASDELVDGRLRDGIAKDQISHVSVFGFARLPLMVYLGTKLDDGFSSDLYQRSRITQSWEWSTDPGTAKFVIDVPSAAQADEINVIVNMSGTIHSEELPEEVRDLPTYVLRMEDGLVGDVNVISSKADLDHFRATWYRLVGSIEKHHKLARSVNLFAAAPLTAAIAIGQAINPQVFESVAVYHRSDGGYDVAVHIG